MSCSRFVSNSWGIDGLWTCTGFVPSPFWRLRFWPVHSCLKLTQTYALISLLIAISRPRRLGRAIPPTERTIPSRYEGVDVFEWRIVSTVCRLICSRVFDIRLRWTLGRIMSERSFLIHVLSATPFLSSGSRLWTNGRISAGWPFLSIINPAFNVALFLLAVVPKDFEFLPLVGVKSSEVMEPMSCSCRSVYMQVPMWPLHRVSELLLPHKMRPNRDRRSKTR